MLTRNDIMRILALLMCILAIPAQTTGLEQDNVIEFLLQKVAELEKNQHECNSFQSRILLELSHVKSKLQQSERRISELEAIVYDIRYDEYSNNLNLTVEDEPVHKPANDNVIKSSKEEKNISVTTEPIGMHSHNPGILSREGRGIATKQIAFCASISSSLIIPIHVNEIIHFDTVLHDEGNGFNKQTGIFTCPLSGTYFFTASLTSPPESRTAVHIMLNGEIKGNIFAHGTDLEQGSNSCIVRCEAGYNVWISVYAGEKIYGEYYMSFSGFLLWGDATGSR